MYFMYISWSRSFIKYGPIPIHRILFITIFHLIYSTGNKARKFISIISIPSPSYIFTHIKCTFTTL